MQIDQIARRLQTEISPCFLCAKNRNDVKAPPAAHGQQAEPFLSPPYSVQVFRTGPHKIFQFLEIYFLLRKFTSFYAKNGEEMIPMQERAQKILLLSAAAVRSRICTSGKSQEEIAERCLCSDRQVRNWTSRDTDISVSRLYALADSLGCKAEDLLIQVPVPSKRE